MAGRTILDNEELYTAWMVVSRWTESTEVVDAEDSELLLKADALMMTLADYFNEGAGAAWARSTHPEDFDV